MLIVENLSFLILLFFSLDKLFLNTDLDIFVIPPSPYLQFFL